MPKSGVDFTIAFSTPHPNYDNTYVLPRTVQTQTIAEYYRIQQTPNCKHNLRNKQILNTKITNVEIAQNENTIIRLTVQTQFCLTFEASCHGQ